MAIYREQEKIWLNKNWVTPGSDGPPPATPPPVPPERKKHPFFLAWLPFRIVYDASSQQPHVPADTGAVALQAEEARQEEEDRIRREERRKRHEEDGDSFGEALAGDIAEETVGAGIGNFFSRWSIEWE